MSKRISVFISSKMQELREERQLLGALLPDLGTDNLSLYPWVFEADATASDSSIRKVYLQALDESELYIGLFWNDYGEWTIDEFHRAGELGITRHLYVKDIDTQKRDPRLTDFLNKNSDVRYGVTPRWFKTLDELKTQVERSVHQWLMEREIAHHSATSAIIATDEEQIPELPRRLIGREQLIDEVSALLEDNDRVLLRGFGGMGKTALAASIAADWLEKGGGQVIWVKAGSADIDALLEAIARVFEAQQQIANKSDDERLTIVRGLLAQNKGLLVLDDAWNGGALAQFVKAVPRRMPLLVTSRQRFPLDEIIEVGELRPNEALKLLKYHLRRDINDDPDAGTLCEILGYHPFALEIAGKSLKVYNMEISELLERIQKAPHDLQMPYGFGELGRSGIKSLLDVSIDALTPDLNDLFVLMGGMFEPTATPELVALSAGQTTDSIAVALDQLAERGLINERQQEGLRYYRMHDLAYSYARTDFINRGLSQQPIIEAVRAYTEAHQQDLTALDVEQSNILEAVEAAQTTGQDALAVDLICSLAVHGPYFAARGHSSQSLRLLESTIEAALRTGENEAAHYLLSKLGNTYIDFIGDQQRALDAYLHALQLARTLGLKNREAILLTVVGKVRFLQHEQDAEDYYAQAEDIARSLNNEGALAFVLHHRGFYEMQKTPHEHVKGRDLSAEAAHIAAAVGLVDIQFFSLINLGGCELELNEHQAALQTHQQAYELAEKHQNYPWMAQALQSMGEDYDRLADKHAAERCLNEAVVLWEQCGGKAQIAELRDWMRDKGYAFAPE